VRSYQRSAIGDRRTAVAALLVGAAAVLSGCRDVKGETRPAPRPVKVITARAAEGAAGMRFAVSIQAYEQIPLAFKASGYVDQVLQRRGADGRLRALQAGDVVPAGAVLARVREADYRERVNQTTASLDELEASQAKARLDLERARTLFAAQALTRPELDAAQAAHDANLARIASMRAQIELAQIGLRDTALVAPRAGIILERKVEVGSLVAAGSVGFAIGDVSAVKALFGVPDSLVHRIAMGQPLAITTEAFRGAQFAGRVTAVSPSADSQSRVFDVEVTIPNADGRLRPGMIGAVQVSPSNAADEPSEAAVQPAVPLAAIVRSDRGADHYDVFVVDATDGDETARARAVTLGPVQGNLVAISAGLAPGERVVVMGATLLKDGDAVRVIP
jgi:RND family efflux transporter MFP subunit